MICENCGGVIQPNDETWPGYPCECSCDNCGALEQCECCECSKCGNMADLDNTVRLSPGEFICLDCHCGAIDRALDARYND